MQEKVQKKAQKSSEALSWLNDNTKHIYIRLGFLTFLAMSMSIISVRLAWMTKIALDAATKVTNDNLYFRIIEIFALIILQVSIQIIYSKVNVKLTARYSMSLKESLFNHLMKKNWQKVSAYHSGELLNRINSDIGVITSGVVSIIPNAIALSARVILSFGSLFNLDRNLALVYLIASPFIFISTRLYGKKMKTLHKKCQETDGATKSFMQECLQNLLVIKAYKNQDKITAASGKFQMANFFYTIRRNNTSILMNIVFFMALTAGYYATMSYCAVKISVGLMTYGTMAVILQLISSVQVPFKDLSGLIPQYYGVIASSERVMELENISDEQNDLISDTSWKAIEIENIAFAYDNEQIFKNAGLTFEKGDFLAICGISGIGKSTLMKLIMGILKPDGGKITILPECADTKASEPVEKPTIEKSCEKSLFSYVPQGNMILSGTIKENIAFYSDIDNEKIEKAAKAAELYEFIETLPNKFETNLGEKGLGLSEGQVQRLAIARAVYYDAPIILLDEATSALDEDTEYKVLKNIKELRNKSCIIISHKNAALTVCNKKIAIRGMKIEKM